MKIGIDARFYNESGVGRYLRNLTQNLKVLDKNNQYFIFLLQKDLKEFQETKNFQKIETNFKWYGFAEQFQLPQVLNRYNLDLIHFPHFNVPIFYSGRFVVTIHDLIHQHYSMQRVTTLNPFAFKIKQIGYRRAFKHAVSKSCKILVPSQYVKKILNREWKIPHQKIVVTHEAVDDKLFTIINSLKVTRATYILNKFNIKGSYIFYVGNAHPHKNVEGLIKAFINLKKKNSNLNLVLSGGDHYFWERIKKEYSVKGIIYTGFINDEELITFYKNAEIFILPSFEEGFGLSVLEAMAAGCPVVASKEGSIPEVGGDAAIYFDPQNTLDITNKIYQVLTNAKLKRDLIEKGKKRVKGFSWKKLGNQTLEVYLQCV